MATTPGTPPYPPPPGTPPCPPPPCSDDDEHRSRSPRRREGASAEQANSAARLPDSSMRAALDEATKALTQAMQTSGQLTDAIVPALITNRELAKALVTALMSTLVTSNSDLFKTVRELTARVETLEGKVKLIEAHSPKDDDKDNDEGGDAGSKGGKGGGAPNHDSSNAGDDSKGGEGDGAPNDDSSKTGDNSKGGDDSKGNDADSLMPYDGPRQHVIHYDCGFSDLDVLLQVALQLKNGPCDELGHNGLSGKGDYSSDSTGGSGEGEELISDIFERVAKKEKEAKTTWATCSHCGLNQVAGSRGGNCVMCNWPVLYN
ncbi:unnamed protein product [Prorocentrum cordatum]|uniref:Uncharacterized protein n=1 Tax=Prorocentrum cordatum TaxID=2364126 RepID=A0ABN9VF30_9DINO|nr:unnamed protein product [Polarella glacialis]